MITQFSDEDIKNILERIQDLEQKLAYLRSEWGKFQACHDCGVLVHEELIKVRPQHGFIGDPPKVCIHCY